MKAVLAAVISIVLWMGPAWVFAKSDYQSGYDHGVSDGKDSCQHSGGCDWYILEKGNGFAHHTWDFVRGYVMGFCSVSPNTSSDADEATWDCDKGPSSASWVTG